MSNTTTDFIRQNEWANLALIDACRGLNDEQMDTTAPGVFGSIRATFGHVVASELYYSRLLGHDVGAWDDDTEPWPGWDGLVEMVKRAANGLIAAAADPDRRVRSSSGKWDIDAPVVVVQAVHHGADHRSQINTLLTTLGLEPADGSSWGWGQDTGRLHPV